MIHFHDPKLSDQTWVRPLLRAEGLTLCSYNFVTLFCWKDAYRFQLARLNDRLLVRLQSFYGHAYLWPAGEGDPLPAIDALAQDAASFGEPLRLIGLTRYHKNWLTANCPDRFAFALVRDGCDYLYSVDRLADLPGKKLHAKRNHIHRLDDSCPGWTWSPLTDDLLPRCVAMDAEWYAQAKGRETQDSLVTLTEEHEALRLALTHRKELGLEGVVLTWKDRVLGFSLGAKLTDRVFDVHFERAWGEIQGTYPAVNRSFAQHIRQTYPQVRYLDREDDMGVPGLRKAKLSYYPDYLQVNFCGIHA
jgi:hypothetical protein